MELILTREHFNEICTIGTLRADGLNMFTLEDRDRKLSQTDTPSEIQRIKVFGKTAIPYGRYELKITMSNRFKKELPLLLNVPGFDGIRIHPGNTSADTEGCILVGTQKDVLNNQILNSRNAFNDLFTVLKEKLKSESVFVTISKLNLSA